MSDQNTWIVGLTGGIASGKSAVSRELAALGVGIVDADALAREVVAKGSEGLAEIVETFGEGVLDGKGSLDRAKLGSIVFADEDARTKLGAITHPRIGALSIQRLVELQAGDPPYVIYEAPLLVETGAHAGMAKVIVVAAAPETQRSRIVERDGLDAAAAQARIDAQLPLKDKLAVADYVVRNDGSLADLQERARQVHREILQARAAMS